MLQVGAVYRHYKNTENYVIIAIALAKVEGKEEKVVVYQALYDCPELASEYGMRPVFVRPYTDFVFQLDIDGQIVQKFSLVTPA